MSVGEYITYQNVKNFFRNKLRKKISVSVFTPPFYPTREENQKEKK